MLENKIPIKMILLILFFLISCSPQGTGQPTPSTCTTYTPVLPTRTLALTPTDTPSPTAILIPSSNPTITATKLINNNVEKGDYLIYLLEGDNKLFFYDPGSDIHIPILPDWDINAFAIGVNNRLAFSTLKEEQSDIYILDYPYWENSPINITKTQEVNEIPHSWSPDGNYLLIESFSEEKKMLEVWDEFEFIQIYAFPDDYGFRYFSTDWSPDGKFAFQVSPGYRNKDKGEEIFVWSGNIEETAINVSRNPSFDDRQPIWSSQGQLAFLSSDKIDTDYYFFITIWEDFSISNGILEGTPLEIVVPEQLEFSSYPSWTKKNSLVFNTKGIFYEWKSGKVEPMNIIQDHGSWGYWGPNEYWASIAPYSEDRIYIHNESNDTILELEGRFPPAWSPEGLLAFCVLDSIESPFFAISIWNGYKSIRILKYNGYIHAMWRNGNYIYCYNG
ncbi:MAG: WD40 repeat domain-containing protein [Anaerolineales bacterium]|jgi:hypothetical protein